MHCLLLITKITMKNVLSRNVFEIFSETDKERDMCCFLHSTGFLSAKASASNWRCPCVLSTAFEAVTLRDGPHLFSAQHLLESLPSSWKTSCLLPTFITAVGLSGLLRKSS